MATFHDIYETVRRSEKKTLIRASGSTRESGGEKVRAGQSYLCKLRGMESEVIELRLREKVSGSFLNQALLSALPRYPYFNTRLIELDGDFYIVQNPQSMVARRTRELARLGHVSCGGHLVDITYYDRSIFFSFHHALCDGRGIKPFIETLMYCYFRLKHVVTAVPANVRLAGEPLLPGETDDPFERRCDFDESRAFETVERDGFALPERGPSESGTDYRYELTVPRDAYMAACASCGATPVILLSLVMSRGIARLYPEWDKPITAHIAADMREALDMPNTYKNCVHTPALPYTRELAGKTAREQAAEFRRLLNLRRDRDYCRRQANGFIGLFDRLDERGSYEAKREMMGFFEGMGLNTYVVSYLGQFNFGDGAKYVSEAHLYNSGTSGLGINMLCAGERFRLDFKQSFPSDKYVLAFTAGLEELGVPYSAGECIPFTTPCDSIMARG